MLTNNININNNSTAPGTPNGQQTPIQNPSYKILFTLLSGSTRQFHSLCKHICMLISNNTNYTNSNAHHQRQARLAQQQLKQQQQAQMQQQQQSPKVSTNNFSHHYTGNNTGTPPYPYHNTAPSTPIHNSSIPNVNCAQSPLLHHQSRNSITNSSNVSGSYVNAGSPSISTPISRRNSNNNTSHPSSPSTSITTALGKHFTSFGIVTRLFLFT